MKKFLNNFLLAWKLPRWRWALLLALISDVLGIAFTFTPPVYWVIDAVTAVVLLFVIGFRWPLLPALGYRSGTGFTIISCLDTCCA